MGDGWETARKANRPAVLELGTDGLVKVPYDLGYDLRYDPRCDPRDGPTTHCTILKSMLDLLLVELTP